MADLSSTGKKLDQQFDRVVQSVSFSIGNLADSIIKIVKQRTLAGVSAEGTPFPSYGKTYSKKKGGPYPVDLYDTPPRKWRGQPYRGIHMLNDVRAYGDSNIEFDVAGTGSKIRGAGGKWVAARDVNLTIQPRSERSRILARIHDSGNYGRGSIKPRPWLGLTVQEADGISRAIRKDLHQIQFTDALDIKFDV